jgi:hypothetical protein
MVTRQLRALTSCFIVCTLFFVPCEAFAQERDPSHFGHAIKATVLDPTTYVPGILVYDSMIRDWDTSQPFFRNGFIEQNARYTRSGRPNDLAISYEDGRRRILMDSLAVVGVSAVHNVSTQLFEQAMRERYPEHRKLVTVLWFLERSAVASLMAYQWSGPHYRQWRKNQQQIAELGLR